ncbi:hypothetical protein LUZ60_001734 [Juncus effusus]|nr:hypothetical protein LUZ60_001734 [Juncus effusus]
MFNNAGIGGDPEPHVVKTSKVDFERVISVNLVGPFLGTKHAARVMIPARSGCIITTSSVASAIGASASYSIRVNSISPTPLATPLATGYVGLSGEEFEAAMEGMANLKGIRLKVDDVANAAVYLASDDGRFISGHNLLMDGGFSVINPSYGIFKDE